MPPQEGLEWFCLETSFDPVNEGEEEETGASDFLIVSFILNRKRRGSFDKDM
jgi:hypothetical protein